MNYELVQKEETKVCGLSVRLTKSQNENYRIITNHWRKFNKELISIRNGNNENWEKFGLTFKKSGSYFYMPAVPFIDLSTTFETVSLPGGKYVKFIHQGDMRLLKTTMYKIYKEIIPARDIKINANSTILHYEHYDYRFNWNKNDSILDIYIPLE